MGSAPFFFRALQGALETPRVHVETAAAAAVKALIDLTPGRYVVTDEDGIRRCAEDAGR